MILTSRAGSAGGPKPGRAGFYLELGGRAHKIASMSTNAALDLRKAKRWLKILHGQVLQLRHDQEIWHAIQTMISANSELHRRSAFYGWLNNIYVSAMAMAIRRQTDTDTRSISMLRFLKLLKGNPSLVSRQRYRALFQRSPFEAEVAAMGFTPKGIADQDYDRIVGKRKSQPTSDDFQAEINRLTRVTNNIVRLANKRIAHHDTTSPRRLPTFAEVSIAIDYLENLVRKYKLLFEAVSPSMAVTHTDDWTAIFRSPWLK